MEPNRLRGEVPPNTAPGPRPIAADDDVQREARPWYAALGLVGAFMTFLGVARLAAAFDIVWPPLAYLVVAAFFITVAARLFRRLRAPGQLYQDLSDEGRPLWRQVTTLIRLLVIVVVWVVIGAAAAVVLGTVVGSIGLTDTTVLLIVSLGTFFGVPTAGSVWTERWWRRRHPA